MSRTSFQRAIGVVSVMVGAITILMALFGREQDVSPALVFLPLGVYLLVCRKTII